jgi:hypothetical protein
MPPRTFSEQWESLRSRFDRLRSPLRTTGRSHSLALLLWPVVALIIAILAIRKASNVKDLADLISSLASLAWPVVIVSIIYWFKPELRAFLSRIRKGKFLGTEFELDELQAKTVAAEAEADLRPDTYRWSGPTAPTTTATNDIAQDAIEEVLREAARSPKLGLMLLSTKIERAARELVAETDIAISRGPLPLRSMIEALVRAGQFSSEGGEALALFSAIRNRIVHGEEADDDEIARAIDSGTRLLRLLVSGPRPSHETDAPGA